MAIYVEGDIEYKVDRQGDDPDTVFIQSELRPGIIEVWHDHRKSGSGMDNWEFSIGDDNFDLEFCRSFLEGA
jgi:hypothetical protein